ncbi:MAG: nucleotidyltransferase family protein, partial [Oscillospiraceae bacterium]|nr:nucleotidyltransferase family protein [Oscillospiraceae bacterium]
AGADLVVELPLPYVLGSAERFAMGGIAILAAVGAERTYLAFGCETPDTEALIATARTLDSPEVQAKIKAGMGAGLSYGAACQAACDTPLLQTPNDLLGIAYIRAIHRLGVDIKPLPVKRLGVAHDSDVPADGYASATYIRKLLQGGGDFATSRSSPWPFLPATAADIFARELAEGRGPASLERLEDTVLALLRLRETPVTGYLDDSEGLSNRIIGAAAGVGSFAELLEEVKTKRYHLSRIRRLILGMCLGLTPSHRPEVPPYIRVLAANQVGQSLLRQMSKTGGLPVITRAAEANKLGAVAAEIMQKEAAVTDLQALCFSGEARKGGSEWRTTPHIV